MKGLRILVSLIAFFGMATTAFSQSSEAFLLEEIQHYRDSLDTNFRDPTLSPLTPEDFQNFRGLDFYPIDLDYYIVAEFIRTPDTIPFEMPTTQPRPEPNLYEQYGLVRFKLRGQKIELPVYQSHSLREDPHWKNYLFLPFTDPTNRDETYGGGRYLELWLTGTDQIVVDFNRAYNPYCAFNIKYSCPIVPKENRIPIPIYAGEKEFKN